MQNETTNQTRSVFWNWVKQHDSILWMGLFLIVCACLVVGCSPSVKDLQESSPEESTMHLVLDPVEESTDIMVDNAEITTEEIPETETESSHLTYDRLPLPTYSDTTYPYYVEELDVTLDIPEGMHVYRTDSIRRHPNGSWFRLECCEWILVTDKEYEESYLSGDLLENLKSEAKHLVFGLVLTEKKLVPLARLFPSVQLCDQIRVTENWYCEIFRHPAFWMEQGGDGSYGILPVKDRARWYDTKLSVHLEQQIQEKTLGTASLNQEGVYLLNPNYTSEEPYLYTMLNSDWWKGYCQAVKELTSHAMSYQYSQEDCDEILRRVEDLRAKASVHWPEGREMIDSFVDQAEDIYLRASYYADSYAYYEGDMNQVASLEDIIVSFQEWSDSQRSYYVMRKDDGFIYGMSDYMVDLQASYQYLSDQGLLMMEK